LRLPPGLVEQRQQSMVEDVGEAGEGRIVCPLPVAGVLGEVQWQRAVRPEQSQEAGEQARRASALATWLDAGEVGRREIELRILGETDRIVGGPPAVTEPGRRGCRLDTPKCLQELDAGRRPGELLEQCAQAIGWVPLRACHRAISPRPLASSRVSVKVLIATCRAK